MANTTSNPKFRAGERVAYITRDDVYLGTVTERLFYVDSWVYAVVWDDGFTDRAATYAESNFRKVH